MRFCGRERKKIRRPVVCIWLGKWWQRVWDWIELWASGWSEEREREIWGWPWQQTHYLLLCFQPPQSAVASEGHSTATTPQSLFLLGFSLLYVYYLFLFLFCLFNSCFYCSISLCLITISFYVFLFYVKDVKKKYQTMHVFLCFSWWVVGKLYCRLCICPFACLVVEKMW